MNTPLLVLLLRGKTLTSCFAGDFPIFGCFGIVLFCSKGVFVSEAHSEKVVLRKQPHVEEERAFCC